VIAHNFLRSIRQRFAKLKMREFAGLPIEEAFDRIYERGTWSHNGDELSGGGSYGRAADEYIALVAHFIRQRGVESILDIGCGDFNIGSRVAPLVTHYLAFDVSARIIELNKRRFASLSNVEFRQINACTEPLPKADLITVRQVLQHLTNAQIAMILENIERSGAEFALITEHLSSQTRNFRPNVDLPSHSSLTRVALGSGVVLSAPPFHRDAPLLGSISLSEPGAEVGAAGEMLNIYLLKPRRM
jgi:SAM-dependent methyltransferase